MLTAGVYNFVDGAFVGQAVGQDGLAGVTDALPYMLTLMASGMLIGFGAAAQVSIKLGEKQIEEAERVLGNAALLSIIISVVLTITGLLALDPAPRLFHVSENVFPFAHDYLSIIILGTGLQMSAYGLNSVIRAEGNTRTAMWTMLIGVLLNVFLAWLFLFVFHWGVVGAGIATVLSQGVSAVWVVSYFLGSKSTLRLRWRDLRFDAAISRKILLIGSPMFALQVASAMMYGVMLSQLNRYGAKVGPAGGDLAVAVWGTVYRFMMLIAMPVFGINQGTQPAIGFNFGAMRFDRVKKALLTGIFYASTITVLGFAVAYSMPAQVISLFVSAQDPHPSGKGRRKDKRQNKSKAIGRPIARTSSIWEAMPQGSASYVVVDWFPSHHATYFQATRKPREALILMLSRQALLIPLLFILPRYFANGLDGVWAAWPCARHSRLDRDGHLPVLGTPPSRQASCGRDGRKPGRGRAGRRRPDIAGGLAVIDRSARRGSNLHCHGRGDGRLTSIADHQPAVLGDDLPRHYPPGRG